MMATYGGEKANNPLKLFVLRQNGDGRCVSWRVGTPSGLFAGVPRLGIHMRLSGVAVSSSVSALASRHRWGGGKDFTPSMPAVCLPVLSQAPGLQGWAALGAAGRRRAARHTAGPPSDTSHAR